MTVAVEAPFQGDDLRLAAAGQQKQAERRDPERLPGLMVVQRPSAYVMASASPGLKLGALRRPGLGFDVPGSG